MNYSVLQSIFHIAVAQPSSECPKGKYMLLKKYMFIYVKGYMALVDIRLWGNSCFFFDVKPPIPPSVGRVNPYLTHRKR